MDKQQILSEVTRIIKEEFVAAGDPVKINQKTNLKEELDLDSLDSVELIMRTEGHFSVTIEDNEAEEVVTVGDIVNLIIAKLKG